VCKNQARVKRQICVTGGNVDIKFNEYLSSGNEFVPSWLTDTTKLAAIRNFPRRLIYNYRFWEWMIIVFQGMLFTPFQNALLQIPADHNFPPPSAVALPLAKSERVRLFCKESWKILFVSPCQCVYRRGKKFKSRFTDFCEVLPSAFVIKPVFWTWIIKNFTKSVIYSPC
jgi:hypothetical protein